MSQYLSLADIAQRWSCSKATARRIVERAKLRATRLSGGTVRYSVVDVERFERRQTEAAR